MLTVSVLCHSEIIWIFSLLTMPGAHHQLSSPLPVICRQGLSAGANKAMGLTGASNKEIEISENEIEEI